jgi:hypothetical protein
LLQAAVRTIKPLYVATFIFGATAAVVVYARHQEPPPSASLVKSIRKMGFQSVSEFKQWGTMVGDPQKTEFSDSELGLLRRLLERGGDAGWEAVYSLEVVGDARDRDVVLPDLRSFAAGHEKDPRLREMMEGWMRLNGGDLVKRLAADAAEPLSSAARAALGKEGDDGPE